MKPPQKHHKVKLELAPAAMGTRAWIDGMEITYLVDVVVEHAVGEMPRITITFVPGSLEADEYTFGLTERDGS